MPPGVRGWNSLIGRARSTELGGRTNWGGGVCALARSGGQTRLAEDDTRATARKEKEIRKSETFSFAKTITYQLGVIKRRENLERSKQNRNPLVLGQGQPRRGRRAKKRDKPVGCREGLSEVYCDIALSRGSASRWLCLPAESGGGKESAVRRPPKPAPAWRTGYTAGGGPRELKKGAAHGF